MCTVPFFHLLASFVFPCRCSSNDTSCSVTFQITPRPHPVQLSPPHPHPVQLSQYLPLRSFVMPRIPASSSKGLFMCDEILSASSTKSEKGKTLEKGGNSYWKSIGLDFKTPCEAIEECEGLDLVENMLLVFLTCVLVNTEPEFRFSCTRATFEFYSGWKTVVAAQWRNS
ncbi:hypothetical protein OROHE_025511 [Orobanche hederae]